MNEQESRAAESEPTEALRALPLESYSDEDRAFFAFWYGHMLDDLMQPPLIGVGFSTARYIWDAARAKLTTLEAPNSGEAHQAGLIQGPSSTGLELHGLDTAERVRFYEHDFYPLSNFSAFNLRFNGRTFQTSEHAYHFEKFPQLTRALGDGSYVRDMIWDAPSAHEAFKVAEKYKSLRRGDWDDIKVGVMRAILRAKVEQHEYVKRKLLATGERELVEDSWRDDFWGWGPDRDGLNMLGQLWMEVRAELRGASHV